MLLTLSPVPLTATARPHHVLTASMAAKATLRAAIDAFVLTHEDADYFPSYEIVTSPFAVVRGSTPMVAISALMVLTG